MSTPQQKKDAILLARLKEASQKLATVKRNGFIAYSWDVDECMRRIHDMESRLQALEAMAEEELKTRTPRRRSQPQKG